MNPETIRGFDCVEFKRRAQVQTYEETKGMTPKEEIEYFRRRADEGRLGEWWRKVKEHHDSIKKN